MERKTEGNRNHLRDGVGPNHDLGNSFQFTSVKNCCRIHNGGGSNGEGATNGEIFSFMIGPIQITTCGETVTIFTIRGARPFKAV